MENNEDMSFQDLKNSSGDENLHNYLIQPPEDPQSDHENLMSHPRKTEEDQENETPEEKMIIVQQFLQNPYDPTIREKLNFSPQKILKEKFPELQHLNLKNQYNFYKSLAGTQDSKQPHWEQLYELDKVQRGAKELLKRNIEEEKKHSAESECTFQPMMQLTKDSKFGKKVEETNFLERAKLWEQQKKEKIEQFRIRDLDKDLQSTNSALIAPKGPEKDEDKESGKKGVDTFLKRQYQARQTKKEKEDLIASGNTQSSKYGTAKKRVGGIDQNYGSNRQTNSEKKPRSDEIYISDVSYGDAMSYLHKELHKLKL